MKLVSLAVSLLLAHSSALNLGLWETPAAVPVEKVNKHVRTFASKATSLIKKGAKGGSQIESWHPSEEDDELLQEAKKLLGDFEDSFIEEKPLLAQTEQSAEVSHECSTAHDRNK